MKKVLLTIAATVGVFLGSFGLAAATSTFIVQQGGTGANTFTPGLIGGSGTNPLYTSATTTFASANSTLTVTGTLGALVGGANSTIALNLGNANSWTALQTFANSTTTAGSFTYASSTAAFFGTLNLPLLTGTQCLHEISGVVSGTGSDCGSGGGSWPFTPTTHWGQNVQATTTALWFEGAPYSLFASSTALFDNASTTQLTVSGGNNNIALTVGSTTAPLTSSTLVQYANQDGFNSDWSFKVAGNGDPVINFAGSTGTLDAPATTTLGHLIGEINGYAYGNGAFADTARIGFISSIDSVTSFPSEMTFSVVPEGLTTRSTILDLNGVTGLIGIGDVFSPFHKVFLDPTHITVDRTQTIPNLTGAFALGSYYTGFLGGSVPFGSSGLLATSSSFIWDNANSRLGLGTSTPYASLSVEGSSALGNSALAGFFTATTTTKSTFPNASTTLLSVATNAWFGSTNQSSFNSSGALTLGTALTVTNGGTGQGTFSSSQLLYGNLTNALTSVATTTATFSGPFTLSATLGALVGGSNSTITWNGLSTTSNLTSGQILYNTTGGNGVASIGTSSISVSPGLTNTGTLGSQVGGSALTLKQIENRSFSYATATAWTGTTTIPLEIGYGEVWNTIKCFPDVGTLNVHFGYGSASTTMFNASTTVGTVGATPNNTMTSGNKVLVAIGTPASSPTKITCTVNDTN